MVKDEEYNCQLAGFSSSLIAMSALSSVYTLLAASTASSPPSFPFGGGLIWWIICARRKEQSIGGWLLFYYWQIFSGAALGAILLVSVGYSAYMPEAYNNATDHWLFVLSGAPSLLLLFVHAAAALMLLCVRTWDALVLLRNIVLAQVSFQWLAVAIDAWKFRGDSTLDIIAALQMSAWLLYLFQSERVERVFKYDNWEQAAPAATLGLA
jgi:succinate dehydrogenase/fumarate reductase cytochrome b subunit